MAIETVAVTGGNGRIGGAIIEECNAAGYETVDVARGKQREEVSDRYVTADLLDAGEVYGALAMSGADAVVHMATVPSPIRHPGYKVFESNTASTYAILEAAGELGVESVVLPSSVNVMGGVYQDPPIEVDYLPVDEAHPVTPRDPYAISKHAIETTGAGFGRRAGPPTAVSSLRLPWVLPGERLAEEFGDADRALDAVDADAVAGRDDLCAYVHLEDAARAARMAAEADFAGHEAFWIVAADTTMDAPSEDVAREFFPDAEVRASLSGTGSLVSTAKARELLGWKPRRSWRD